MVPIIKGSKYVYPTPALKAKLGIGHDETIEWFRANKNNELEVFTSFINQE